MRRSLPIVRQWLRNPAVALFLWSRLAIWAAVLFALLSFPPGTQHPPQTTHDVGYVVDVWARWDSDWLLQIARSGYHAGAQTAFYPLYPALVALLGRIFLGHYVVAGVAISLTTCLGSFVLLRRLALRHLDADAAGRAVLYLAIFPMALFLQALYNESLYLLLTVYAFERAERGRFLPAGVAAGAAMLTRSAGAALLPALALVAWRSERRREALASLCVAPLLFCAWPLWLWHSVGSPTAFLSAQKDWNRHHAAAGPFGGLWLGLRAAVDGIRDAAHAALPLPPGASATTALQIAMQNVEAFFFAVVFLFLAILTWRLFGAAYGVFALVSLALPLSFPTDARPLLSMPRFGLAIFPFFLALGAVSRRRNLHGVLLASSALMLGIAIVQWARYDWVS